MTTYLTILESSEFWSAIIGAIVGGAIGIVGQWMTIIEARKERALAAEERGKALAHSLLFKLMEIHGHFGSLNETVSEATERRRSSRDALEYWQVLLPLANFPDHVRFSSDEMAMLLSLGDNDVFNTVGSLDKVHNAMVDAFRKYAELRHALSGAMPALMNGNLGTTILTPEQMQIFGPQIVDLNSIAHPLCERIPEDLKRAARALMTAHGLLRKKKLLTTSLELTG